MTARIPQSGTTDFSKKHGPEINACTFLPSTQDCGSYISYSPFPHILERKVLLCRTDLISSPLHPGTEKAFGILRNLQMKLPERSLQSPVKSPMPSVQNFLKKLRWKHTAKNITASPDFFVDVFLMFRIIIFSTRLSNNHRLFLQ